VARTTMTTHQEGEGKQNPKSGPDELSETELDQVSGGSGADGGRGADSRQSSELLTASDTKVASGHDC
jgi:bacteriocin-like protein